MSHPSSTPTKQPLPLTDGDKVTGMFLGSLYSSPEVRRGQIGRSGNDAIGMNPHGTIGSNNPQVSGRRCFNIFNSVAGISVFSNRKFPWHDEPKSENPGHEIILEMLGARIFEVEMMGTKILKFSFKRFPPTELLPTPRT